MRPHASDLVKLELKFNHITLDRSIPRIRKVLAGELDVITCRDTSQYTFLFGYGLFNQKEINTRT